MGEAQGCEASPSENSKRCWEGTCSCAHGGTTRCCSYKMQTRTGPRVTDLFGDNHNIWTTGWSPLLQIGQDASQLLVRGHVKPDDSSLCGSTRISEVVLSGDWLGGDTLKMSSGSLESSSPFSLQIGSHGPWQQIPYGTTPWSASAFNMTTSVLSDDPVHWGPDAHVSIELQGVIVKVAQHTSGRFEQSTSNLDVSVHGKVDENLKVGGWLGSEGRSMAAGVTPTPCLALDPFANSRRSMKRLRWGRTVSQRDAPTCGAQVFDE